MVEVLQAAILILLAAAGTGVVLTRDHGQQVIGVSFFGFLLTLLFTVYQAPDVALSEIVVGAVALPLMVLLAHASTERHGREQRRRREHSQS
ncbi:MAG TPA: hydrogenase subunit MbhD domain-containing protein [Opitutaceae bacterium]|jgi:uncharacterized MnhB-related membrane protein|nr:hydrogenase subunit MbhD domain-containing protein [Opitutaceae bacterium]